MSATDCGLVADAEYCGEVERVGSGWQGFFELAVSAHLLDGCGQAGEVLLDQGRLLGLRPLAVLLVTSR